MRERGATAQRPLWASTGTKDPELSDVLYVERLVGQGIINTMPERTLRAFADHGRVPPPLADDAAPARALIDEAATAGLDLDRITAELEREGVASFCDSYHQLLACIQSKLTLTRG